MNIPPAVLEAHRQQQAKRKYTPHQPHAVQIRFMGLDVLEALYGGAAGGGKSDALLMDALKYVHLKSYSAIIFRRTYTELALPDAIMARSHEWLANTDAHWNGENKLWRFPSGATLAFGYLDSPNDHFRYLGSAYQYVAFDELTRWASDEQYTYLFSRMRRLEGSAVPLRMRAATNPGGLGHEWVGKRFGIPKEPERGRVYERDGRLFLPARVEDNPTIDLKEYELTLSKLDPIRQAQLRHGHWVLDPSGLVYSSFDEARNTTEVIPSLPADEGWIHILGCDFGVTSPTAYVVLAFSEHDPNLYVLQSEEWRGLSSLDAKDIAVEWDERYKFERIIGDTGGLGKDFEIIWRQRHFPMHAAKKENKLGYISLINSDFHHGAIKIVAGSNKKLIADLKALAWADDKQNKEHPALDNHLPDALLYAWRHARHWNWEERERKPATPEEAARAYSAERRAKLAERNRRAAADDNDDWIIEGP